MVPPEDEDEVAPPELEELDTPPDEEVDPPPDDDDDELLVVSEVCPLVLVSLVHANSMTTMTTVDAHPRRTRIVPPEKRNHDGAPVKRVV